MVVVTKQFLIPESYVDIRNHIFESSNAHVKEMVGILSRRMVYSLTMPAGLTHKQAIFSTKNRSLVLGKKNETFQRLPVYPSLAIVRKVQRTVVQHGYESTHDTSHIESRN